jgi:ABC-type thiamin/hydroxymethylpyrimidine transport system permease subunit
MPWFVAWAAVGAGYAFGVLGALSIGVFVLAIAAVATVLLARHPQARTGLIGLVSGLGLPLLFVAFLNRAGPGTVCTTTATSQSCSEEWSPWPWLLIGVALVVVGCVWFGVRSRRQVSS